ncbi:MAG: class I SAM-dependent methyltransferase [Bdellovibrionaceae bacterium]|jgi:2-polyprenyl-3-methyl-5-hydroxy-6-metoxy-1,4-benzoquinol methylase|nr:class I SAM-dependent methyltransferase [Pseudobdellovibrionaceae bacterium]
MKTASFYNLRGELALDKKNSNYSWKALPLNVSAPYAYFESVIRSVSTQDSQLIDLCCGAGIHSIAPSKFGCNVTGVDISPKSIDAAKWLAKINRVEDSTQFTVNDILEVLTQESKFDIIIMSGSLYYFDPNKIIPLILNKLKPGGHFICVETNGSNFLMNSIRKLKNSSQNHRDERTLKHLLKITDINNLSYSFEKSNIVYFDLLSLLGGALPNFLKKPWHYIATRMDRVLLNYLFLKRLSFKFVFHGIKKS